MKLFSKYSRVNIIASVLVFIIGCTAFYFLLNYVLITQIDETLENEQEEIIQYINKWKSFPDIINTEDQQINVQKMTAPGPDGQYTSSKQWNEMEKKEEWMRQLVFGVSVNGCQYQVTVKKSEEQAHHLLKLIVLLAAKMIALILVVGIVINRMLLKRLWQPFYATLDIAENYSLVRQQALALPQTKIDEFSLLNDTLNSMTQRIHSDYKTLKEFTGNAAHEMQTPLAVINANTESLVQNEALLKLHHSEITAIEQSAKRLSRLNQSLLLLAKIESHRFEFNEMVDWKAMVEQQLDEIRELLHAGKINIQTNLSNCVTIFNQQFAAIIITNLINNAVRYNRENGSLGISLTQEQLIISNTSNIPSLDATMVFKRFYRHPASNVDGNGLGLSIVQQICKEAGYKTAYQYLQAQHVFTIIFKS